VTTSRKQDEKRNPADFAIWIKADPEHIMRWNSPWSVGFPALAFGMSAMRYAGTSANVLTLQAAATTSSFRTTKTKWRKTMVTCGCTPARTWMHCNMLLLNGKKMSKSDGNSIMPEELFSGNSAHITKGYSPMAVRFFMLQNALPSDPRLRRHEAPASCRKRLSSLDWKLTPPCKVCHLLAKARQQHKIKKIREAIASVHEEMNDDFNTPKALARLFEDREPYKQLEGRPDQHGRLE